MDERTLALLEKVADQAAEKAVHEAFTRVGLDPSDPINAQRDMARLRELGELAEDPEWQRDLLHLRRWRKTMETIHTRGIMASVVLVVTGAGAMLWAGFTTLSGK